MGVTTLKIRDEFLISALFIETNITKFLSEKLDIHDPLQSEILGNTENGLNFSQKTELFLETADLSIIDKSKVSVYREVKKAFSSGETDTVESYLKSPEKHDDFLLILYPQSDAIPREEKLVNACYLLIDDVSNIVSHITQKPEVKLKQRGILHKIGQNVGKLSFIFSFLLMR